jgi:hypothetical protein
MCGFNALAQGKIYIPRLDKPEATRHADTVFFFTANTPGNGANGLYAGAEQLDSAFCDRFRMLYAGPDRAVEVVACGGDEVAVKVIDAVEAARKRADEYKVRRCISVRIAVRAAVDARLEPTLTAREHLKAQCKEMGWPETELNTVWC